MLFSFLSDQEASRVARALCIPGFLSFKAYDIKKRVFLQDFLAGDHSGVVRRLWYDGQGVQMSNVPESVTSVQIQSHHMKAAWRADSYPRSLTSLTIFGPVYGVLSRSFQWPPHLTELKWQCNGSSNVPLPNLRTLPQSLTSLTLTGPFSPDSHSETTLILPQSLKHLQLSGRAFVAITSLPSCLQSLHIDNDNRYVMSALPDLPSSLEELRFSGWVEYQHALHHATLRKLHPPRNYQHRIRASDFPCLQELILSDYKQPLDDLPSTLIHLQLHLIGSYQHDLNQLPSSLQELNLFTHFQRTLDHLPAALKMLRLSSRSEFNRPLDHLPPSLEEMLLPTKFNHPLDKLPRSLRVLTFASNSKFNHPLNNLPDSLTELRLGCKFNQPFQRLPRQLMTLDLRAGSYEGQFNHLLPLTPSDTQDASLSYPTKLRRLLLGHLFNQPLTLPPSLTQLSLPSNGDFSHPLPASALPEGLLVLELSESYLRSVMDTQAVHQRCPFVNMIAARSFWFRMDPFDSYYSGFRV